MSYVVSISGSPAAQSRSTHLLSLAESSLRSRGIAVRRIDARALPPAALMHADFAHPSIREALELIEHAQAVVISTPLYKASYSGLVKTLLDLLPQTGLAGKIVLPIATGGSLAHLLALDYALKPVLSSLGARHHLPRSASGYVASPETVQRVSASADALAHALDEQAQLRELRTKAASLAAASAPRETAATLAALIRCAT
jgi:FMN reductase